jgi:hypothetical protein
MTCEQTTGSSGRSLGRRVASIDVAEFLHHITGKRVEAHFGLGISEGTH